ncbi:MAG: ParB/RepB/Spo0J family partition protein [Anaerolineae bacterium]
MTRRGLGRGLDALLATDESAEGNLRSVAVESVEPNPYQPRGAIGDDGLAELADSIKAHGVIQPLVVTEREGQLQLIAGERRWRAARLAGLTEVPVIVRQAEPRDMLALALIENVQRWDLDPIEAAMAYLRLTEEFGLTQEEVAGLVGKSRAAVTNAIRLLQLGEDLQELVRAGRLSEGHARALLGVSSVGQRVDLAEKAVAGGWSVRRLEAAVRDSAKARSSARSSVAAPAPEAPAPGSQDPHVIAAEKDLEEALGTRVEVRRRGDSGQIVVYFYSDEELDALYRRFLGRP